MNERDRVQSLIERFEADSIPLDVLITAYEAGDGSFAGDLAIVHDTDSVDAGVMHTVRDTLGLTADTIGVELLGDAIERIMRDRSAAERTRWHDVKVRLLSEREPSRKRIAIRHLSRADFEDEAVLAAALESLIHDDQEIAVEMAQSIGWNVAPANRAEVVTLLLETLEDTTRRLPSRAAYVMSAIHGVYETGRIPPPDDVLRRVGAIVTSTDDSAAFAGASDLASLAVGAKALTVIEEWLRGPAPMLLVLALSAIVSRTASPPTELCPSLRAARATLLQDEIALDPRLVTWALTKLDSVLGACP